MRRHAIILLLALVASACGGAGGGGSASDPEGTTGAGEPAGSDEEPSGGDEPSGDAPPTGTTSMPPVEEALALEVLDLVNLERSKMGLGSLAFHGGAADVAYAHCVDMDVRDFFAHTNPDGESPGDRLAAAGITGVGWGENIAWGYPSPEAVMDGWMNSAGHRTNILNPGWTHLGIGVHSAPGGPWWTQVFLQVP